MHEYTLPVKITNTYFFFYIKSLFLMYTYIVLILNTHI